MNQPYVYIHPLPLNYPSQPLISCLTHQDHHRAPSWAPCVSSSFPLAVYFTHGTVHIHVTLSIHPTLSFPPLCPPVPSLYLASIPALQIGSSVPIFSICFSLSDLLHSVSQALGSSTSQQLFFATFMHTTKWFFFFLSEAKSCHSFLQILQSLLRNLE